MKTDMLTLMSHLQEEVMSGSPQPAKDKLRRLLLNSVHHIPQAVLARAFALAEEVHSDDIFAILHFFKNYVHHYKNVTALVPAYNEESCIGETIESLLKQTVPFYEILIINDCSTDRTAEVASTYPGVRVLTPPKNGGKSKALNYGIARTRTEFFLTIDADTILEPDCLERLIPHVFDEKLGAVSGYVLPRHITTLWERGRFIEYIIGQGLNKQAQKNVKSVIISAGCCSLYRTSIVQKVGGFSSRTITEDLDLTWNLFEAGYQIKFEPKAQCWSMEPKSLNIFLKQLDRWNMGMFANWKIHKRSRLKTMAIIYGIEAVTMPIVGLAALTYWPLQTLFSILAFLIFCDFIFAGVLTIALRWDCRWKIIKYLPSYVIVRPLNLFTYVRAFYKTFMKGENLHVWTKGH